MTSLRDMRCSRNIVTGLPKLKYFKDHLCSFCELGKAKRKSFHIKTTPSSKRRLQLLHMDICGPMPVESINGKKYVLVIVDDYSRYTWTHFLRSKDETPEVLIDFLTHVDEVYFSFGRHSYELHVTWAHLEKKRIRLRTNTKTLEDLCSQTLETASQAKHDAFITHQVTASQLS
ncbi:retrovirus-related pol polyprotein from transposon TNT 1-94 [Tanacetum coccineum]